MKKVAAYLYEKPAFLFLAFTVIAFLPVLLPFFYIKNDLVTQILPTRFIISESIHSGFSPWWNPYINYGIPQYGDMNCGFWNPVLWVFAALFRYDIWTITFEEVFYIFLSGWGMFLVLRELSVSKKVAILSGFSYMCSGYILGHMQHFCWITGAAFFPFVFLYFIRINKNPSGKNWITGSLFSFFFLSSAHPGLIIGALYFFFFSLLAIFLFRNSFLLKKIHPSIVKNNIIFLALTVLLSLCVIISYTELLPLMTRGEKLSNEDSIFNATTLQSYMSLIFPLAVHKSGIFNTDISMRNVYIGFFSLPGLFFFYKNFNRKIVLYTLFCLAFFILLSSGGLFKTVANTVIPFASYVRSSGEFSIFSIFILITCGALGFQFLKISKGEILKWAVSFKTIAAVVAGCLVTSIVVIFFTHQSIIFSPEPGSLVNIKEKIKFILDAVSFWDLVLMQSCLNLIIFYSLKKAIARQNTFRIAFILSVSLIVITWLTLPYTGVGAKSKKEVDAILFSAPEGIHGQPLLSINKTAITDSNYIAFTGLPYAYLKTIGTPEWNPYPIQLNTNFSYFKDSSTVKFVNDQPFLFLSIDTSINSTVNEDASRITIIANGPGYIKASVRNRQFKFITLLQNNYQYWRVFINGQKVNHFTGYATFISAEVPKKDFTIEYRFDPKKIIVFAWINLCTLIAAVFCSSFLWTKKFPGKNNFKKIQ